MTEVDVKHMLDSVLIERSNPRVPSGLAERLKAGTFANDAVENILSFRSFDQQAATETRKTIWGALLLHAAVLLVAFAQVRALHDRMTVPARLESEVILAPPPVRTPSAKLAGGGGGHTGPAPVSRGNPPKFAPRQLVPPELRRVEDAKLPVEPTVVVQQNLQMAHSDIPHFGLPNAPNVGTSLGNGGGTGIGAGYGNGVGPGSGGNMGGGLRRIGGGVSAPIVLFAPVPEFSEEARKAKVSGNVLVYLQVDELGRPMHIRVLRGIGMGLDEKAIEAVRQYRFKPALEDGKPVPVELQVEVNFNIY
jgi:protein TonB